MKIVPKILILVILSIALAMGSVSYLIIQNTQDAVHNQIDRLLITNLEFAKTKILEVTEDIKQTTEIVAHHPEISKSLHLQLSRGINRILNEMVVIYPFYNYVMIVDSNGDVFAVSTRDNQGHKIAGEQLLGLNFRQNPLYSEPSPSVTITGNPGPDPFLSVIEMEGGMSQWFITPVQKRGELIGWAVVSYDWQNELSALLADITRQLLAVGNPIIEAILVDENGNIVVGAKSTEKRFLLSPDKVWKEKRLKFGNSTMRLIISNDKTKTYYPVIDTRNFLLAIIISSTVLLVIILYVILQKTFLKRLKALHVGTEELGRGNLDYKVGTDSKDEIGQLSRAFDKMAKDLKKTTTSIDELNKEITERKEVEKVLQKRTHDLGERVKELNCLYSISNLIEQPGISLDEILQGTVELIPPSWQYPEITSSRAILNSQEYRTKNFRETIWRQTSDIVIQDEKVGSLQVFYREERPESDEGPFLKEERILINAIAEQLGKIIDHKQDEEELKRYQEQLEQIVQERTRDLKETQRELINKAMEAGMAQMSAIILHNIGNAITPIKVHIEGIKPKELERTLHYLEECYRDLNDHAQDLNHYMNEDPRGKEVFAYMGELINSLIKRETQMEETCNKINGGVSYISDILALQQAYVASEQETRERTSLNSLIYDAIRMQTGALEKRGITIKEDLSSDLPNLIIDKNRLLQVLVNLIKNSYEAIDELGDDDREKVISFRSFAEDENIGFQITDTGIGIEPERIGTIFEFGRSNKGSSGFGLHYCKMFVEANRGTLNVGSPGKGKGVTVRVMFKIMAQA